MRVAHNLVMDGYRSARMRRGEIPHEGAEEVETAELTDQVLTAHLVQEALSHLPETHRRAIEATYLRDWTTEQAARRLNRQGPCPLRHADAAIDHGRAGCDTRGDAR
jgi:RNA polymerase sigma-70 factor (ECF subfamily)